MAFKTAIVNMKEAAFSAGKPLMLHELLFCPIITWVCEELQSNGVRRFFVVCDEAWQDAAGKALSSVQGVELFSDAAQAVKAAEEETLVIPSAVVPVHSFAGSPVYAARSADVNAADLSAAPERCSRPLDWMPLTGRKDLQRAAALCRELLNERFMADGVTIVDPAATYIDPRCRIGAGTVLLPGTILRGRTVIGADCEIGPNSMIRDCTVGDGTTVNASQLNESTVGSNTTVGPFTYVRPHCHIGDHCRVGDFVEMKNSTVGNGTKVSHLTYVGDSDVGEDVNFGCGTVTSNYDGHKKYRCTIGNHVFLGCNTNLVAPVTVGDGAYTAAGSTVTEDVPGDALAIARERQTNKPDWAAKFRRSWEEK